MRLTHTGVCRWSTDCCWAGLSCCSQLSIISEGMRRVLSSFGLLVVCVSCPSLSMKEELKVFSSYVWCDHTRVIPVLHWIAPLSHVLHSACRRPSTEAIEPLMASARAPSLALTWKPAVIHTQPLRWPSTFSQAKRRKPSNPESATVSPAGRGLDECLDVEDGMLGCLGRQQFVFAFALGALGPMSGGLTAIVSCVACVIHWLPETMEGQSWTLLAHIVRESVSTIIADAGEAPSEHDSAVTVNISPKTTSMFAVCIGL